ncbi:phage tail protein, partial [Pseudomonas sp. WS 5071]|nr:phage tail protein [Pseudomonas sp. WS 5071]
IGRTGYIIFPSWLNGWIVQWSAAVSLTGSTINTTRFPIPFPNDAGAVIVGAYNNATTAEYSVRLSDGENGTSGGAVTRDSFKTYNTGVTGSAGLSYIAVGS